MKANTEINDVIESANTNETFLWKDESQKG